MKATFLGFLLAISLFASAQKYGNIWYFGLEAGLDFNGCDPVVLTNGKSHALEGGSTVCDASGQLLFYTDGDSIWNKQHALMQGGRIRNAGYSSLSQNLILPKPGSTSIYYVITGNVQAMSEMFQYCVVDMGLNGGLGAVTATNIAIGSATVTEQVAATWHANGTDIWLMSHEYGTNKFMAYLVSAAGIATTPVVSAVGPAHAACNSNMNARGDIKFSPDGARVAFSGNGVGTDTTTNLLTVFNFDKSTGLVSNPIDLPYSGGDYGLSFSPDSKKLYGTTWKAFNFPGGEYNRLYQFDLSLPTVSAIQASRVYIESVSLTQPYGSIKLGPDGKIYVAANNATALGVIKAPNQAGLACNYVANGFSLGGRKSRYSLSNYIEYRSYCTTTGVSEMNVNALHASIFPNPFSDAATLRFDNPSGGRFTLRVVDALGRTVHAQNNVMGEEVPIDRTGLATGVYFVELRSEQTVVVLRMAVK